MAKTKPLEEILKQSPEIREEIEHYANYLWERRHRKPRVKPKFTWAGGLKHLKDKFTSVELQHEISKLRAKKL